MKNYIKADLSLNEIVEDAVDMYNRELLEAMSNVDSARSAVKYWAEELYQYSGELDDIRYVIKSLRNVSDLLDIAYLKMIRDQINVTQSEDLEVYDE